MTAATNEAMLIDIAGDYPICTATNGVVRTTVNANGLGIGGNPSEPLDIYASLGATSSATGVRITATISASQYTLGYGIATDGSGNVYSFVGNDNSGFAGSVLPLKLTGGGPVIIGGGAVGSLSFAGRANPTVSTGDYTPICSRVEFHSASAAVINLLAGNLAEGTILICTYDNTSSYVTVNGHLLQTGGCTFIKTHDNGWVCIGFGSSI
jgi:hypothetical protein